MIKLKNVSKFYYSKGVIATGFSKLNVQFKIGEFVAITGESGSGKSTLLNVISGLDSYEEGEMYVNGKETSHYIEKDWEEYRRKNIGNIYQNFNLINSYTVYQNIELALSLNGVSKKYRTKKILDLLKRVNMTNYKNTKVSKLSGGQKQRVAIARALAKDIPIIIADEPTGNLDKRAAQNVIRLLKEISKDKLVIIVTHNYEQVKEYVTRKITMHDGKIIEDSKITDIPATQNTPSHEYKNISFIDKIKLGTRNTFNVLPKFILLFLVYSFIICALMGEYSFFKKSEYEAEKSGYNEIYLDTNDHRIILNKKDKTAFNSDELERLKELRNVDYIMENDAIVDQTISITDLEEDFWLSGVVNSKNLLPKKIDYGRPPTNENEIVIEGDIDNYYLSDVKKELLNNKYYTTTSLGEKETDKEYTITGIIYNQNPNTTAEYKFYVSDELLNKLLFQTHEKNSTITIDFMGTNHISSSNNPYFKLEANNWVTPTTAIISEDLNAYCYKGNCRNKTFNINVDNIYYSENKEFKIEKIYTPKNIKTILELPSYQESNYEEFYNGIIYINPIDYNQLFNKGTYQISLYVKDINKIKYTQDELEERGYHTLLIKDTLVNNGSQELIKIVKLLVTITLVIALFFISYFIIKIILKSRNIYFSILRMLGGSKTVCHQLLIIELLIITNISYLLFITIIELNKTNLINIDILKTVNEYFKPTDYLILYSILIIMSFLTSIRYSRKLFDTSVMNSYREEV